ncbi:hypothetical protein A2755_00530 [Candidatus Wolfebacteria bacterium RIFCSPHIGHO2_01_FULL_48_22]|uniref:Uncharacterized protein n=2 Tax=Candidatus Wolfeibacteriota TaxID=1752735 RepID=A0A1F8DV20_9BACT|nr:MAG: hypothetical protein A2755_00530 [Candidatus Wolfebacteria bacterium RIFCSPHIGHO2_01_FULL_48_22]OGM92649.1 MAG: hypothetical protein A2935_03995 [Candidatus Wolfebacteria bacterium RIFCSPLOWO2_01_FULL_47_17b]
MDFLSLLFEPVKRWLIEQGAWDTLVEFWDAISRLFERLTQWLGVEAPEGGVMEFLFGLLKLSFNILVTIVKVLIDAINWVIGLF